MPLSNAFVVSKAPGDWRIPKPRGLSSEISGPKMSEHFSHDADFTAPAEESIVRHYP
jgi:hypothetical protein